jgi:hypothetical protein
MAASDHATAVGDNESVSANSIVGSRNGIVITVHQVVRSADIHPGSVDFVVGTADEIVIAVHDILGSAHRISTSVNDTVSGNGIVAGRIVMD